MQNAEGYVQRRNESKIELLELMQSNKRNNEKPIRYAIKAIVP